jgi:hypothetical protein
VSRKFSGRRNSGGASFHAPPSLAARAFTRSRESSRPKLASSPLLFCNAGDLQNNKETQQHRQLILVFISDLFFSGLLDLLRVSCYGSSSSLLLRRTGSKERWRLSTGGEGDRLLLLVAGLWALLKAGWRRRICRGCGCCCRCWGCSAAEEGKTCWLKREPWV